MDIQKQMNDLGKMRESFVFLIDFEMKKPVIFTLYDSNKKMWFQTPTHSNIKISNSETQIQQWETIPVSFNKYEVGFDLVKHHIYNGDTYLLNYTQPTYIKTNLTIEDIFRISSAKYKVLFKNEFVCFSPETFVKIEDGKIYSFPMKGTINADLTNSEKILLEDNKEIAEHNTIVDLIRNDLSLIANNVKVDKFRYLDLIKTNQQNLWQVSSQISGELPGNYINKIGDIIFQLLPAGSISGAPKKKTLEIIRKAEKYERGYYTGIFGYFDGRNLESCVLIRYIEKQKEKLVYKSGGGITFMSDAVSEYEELLKKIYVPIA